MNVEVINRPLTCWGPSRNNEVPVLLCFDCINKDQIPKAILQMPLCILLLQICLRWEAFKKQPDPLDQKSKVAHGDCIAIANVKVQSAICFFFLFSSLLRPSKHTYSLLKFNGTFGLITQVLTGLSSLALIGLGSYGMYNLDVDVTKSGWKVVEDVRVGFRKFLHLMF